MITIVNYGLGNLGSIFNMLKKIGAKSVIVSDLDEIAKAEKIILPGVGHFDRAMERINNKGLKEILDIKAKKEKIPILGICLGMHLLTRSSEEGILPGLCWIPAETVRFHFAKDSPMKIPHMGWNNVHISTISPLTSRFNGNYRFYFVHSYYVRVDDQHHSILKAKHGIEFDAAIQEDNIYGVQFHPEKSHKYGMRLLENFANL
jgi:imidazole glycerol-phosphate synthase subunit HisH